MHRKGVHITPAAMRHVRGALGVSRKDFASMAGVTRQSVDNYEAGRTWPHVRKLALIETLVGKRSVLTMISDPREQRRYLDHPARISLLLLKKREQGRRVAKGHSTA